MYENEKNLIEMAKGNIGAVKILMECHYSVIYFCKTKMIYGKNIYLIYNDCCNEDMNLMIRVCNRVMIDNIYFQYLMLLIKRQHTFIDISTLDRQLIKNNFIKLAKDVEFERSIKNNRIRNS